MNFVRRSLTKADSVLVTIFLSKVLPVLSSHRRIRESLTIKNFRPIKTYFINILSGIDEVRWLGNKPANKFLHYATMSRLWADSVLRAHVHGKREQSLASALVLGVTDGLDNDLLNAYSASGAMHVLSVSGLHVGIIYWVILIHLQATSTPKAFSVDPWRQQVCRCCGFMHSLPDCRRRFYAQ